MARLWWGFGVAVVCVAGVAVYGFYYWYPPAPPQITVEEKIKGTGAFVFNTQGDEVVMTANYVGTAKDGTVIDDAHASGKAPYRFTFNSPDLPLGWFNGLDGMQIGGTRVITVPGALALSGKMIIYTVTLLSANSNDTGLLPPGGSSSYASSTPSAPQSPASPESPIPAPPTQEQGLLPPGP